MINRFHKRQGSALVIALLSVFILSAVAMSITQQLLNNQRITYQAMGWQDSLRVAEGGVDLAMAELRNCVSNPATAWSGWNSATTPAASNPTAAPLSKTSSVLIRTGLGGTHSWAVVTVDAPPSLYNTETEEQWYRIRSTGYSQLSTRREAVGTKADATLRKLDLVRDRFTQAIVSTPRASRTIEVVARPTGTFTNALLSDGTMSMNNHNILVDSYDSRDPAKSTNGFYDVIKRQQNGHIATNGQLIDAGSAQIYGNAQTNGGTVLNISNVTGQIVDNFYQEMPPVLQPTSPTTPGGPTTVNGTTSLQATASGTTYNLTNIDLSGQSVLTLTGDPNGSATYVQIIVQNNISVSGQGAIVLGPGVFARIFLQGNASISGNGITNPNSPRNLQIYGMPPILNAPQSITISGNGGLRASVYAPTYDIRMVGGGNGDSIYGAFVGKSVAMTGIQSVHYDEALSEGGLISDYRIASWYEDTR